MAIHGKYDHEIKIGTTTKKLRMARDENGAGLYNVTEDIPNYQNPLLFTQENWNGGHGQFDFMKPDLYFEGQSIDTTQEGKVFLGPLINEVKEDDDTDLDTAPVDFIWFPATSEWLCATSGKIYRYIADDTGIDTDEPLTTSETGIDCDADASTPIPVNSIIYIESEKMLVTATGTTLTVVRGYLGSTKATHLTNTDIYIYKWTPATQVDSGGGSVANVTQLCVFGVTVFAACGASNDYYYSTDGDDWTTSTLTDSNAVYFFVAPNAAGTAEVLWKVKTPNELKSNSNGTNAGTPEQWSSAAYIGDASNNITNIFLLNDNLMIGREDNLFHYDSDGGIHPLMNDLEQNRSTNNFKYVTEWQVAKYFSLGKGLGEITSYSAFEPMGPLTDIDDIAKDGTCVGLAADKDWLYVVIDEGTNTIIYKGREVRVSGLALESGLRWEWCPWIFLSTTACATAKVCQHSSTDRRLWFGYGENTAFVILSDNPLADSDARFAASGWLRMSYTKGTNLYWDKLWQSIVTQTKGCTANLTVTPKYRKDTDTGNGAALTAAITTNGTVKTNLTTALNCNRIQFELHLATNSSGSTPEVSLFEARGIEKPETVKVHDVTYEVGDEPTRRGETIRDFLRTGRTSTSLIRFADLRWGDKTSDTSYSWVVMQPGFPKEVEVFKGKGRPPELGIQIRLQEISFTVA